MEGGRQREGYRGNTASWPAPRPATQIFRPEKIKRRRLCTNTRGAAAPWHRRHHCHPRHLVLLSASRRLTHTATYLCVFRWEARATHFGQPTSSKNTAKAWSAARGGRRVGGRHVGLFTLGDLKMAATGGEGGGRCLIMAATEQGI